MPATNSTRTSPFARTHERIAIIPTSPVRYACVPPQGVSSKPSISIKRSSPSRADSFRSLRRTHVINCYRTIFPNDIVRQLDRAFDNFSSGINQLNINLTRLLQHAKTLRRRVEELHKCLRKNVLPGVLLHVVQPARPIDTTGNDRV